MRVLIVNHGYPPFGIAGVERVSEQAASHLTAIGHEVTVLTRRPSAAPPLPVIERAELAGVKVVRISGSAPPGPICGHLDRLDRIFERMLLEIRPDVVLLSHMMRHSPAYVSIAHRWGVPVVMELHDFYSVCERAHLERVSGELCSGPEGGRACAVHCFAGEDDAPGKSVLRTSLFHRAVTEADALVVPSRFVADYFRDIRGPGSQVHVIPNGITLDTGVKQARERPLEGPLHLASLGALTPHKGAHVVVEALRMASPLSARYTLFGGITQPYTCELREVAKRVEGLEMRIYGPYEPASLPALLADVHALIIPSVVWETFSIVAREAMCCGVPVIASRLGALPEAVREGENGLLFTAGSSSELAVLLRSLDADRMRLDRMRSGIRSTDWISVSERTSRLEALLEEVWAVGVRQTTTDAEREETEALRALLAN